jgi:hypothetical protein
MGASDSNAARDRKLQFPSPLGWEHFNLTEHYTCRQNRKADEGKYPALRDFKDRSHGLVTYFSPVSLFAPATAFSCSLMI